MAIEQIERLPDVSFIDDDINLDGTQKQMLQDYQDKYMEETGEETVLHEFPGIIEAPNWLNDGNTLL